MATPTPTRPQPTGFDVAFALLSLTVALFSIAGSFLAFFVSTGTLLSLDTSRWVALAPTFIVTAILPFLLHKEARVWASTPLAILVPLRDWEKTQPISATLARLCVSTFWIVILVTAFAPKELATTPMLVVHAAHAIGWPFSFWMAVVRPQPKKA